MANPMPPQARAQIEALERWLLKQGVDRRARAMIVLSHPEVAVSDADRSAMLVLLRDQVADYLCQAAGPPAGRSLLAGLEQLRR